MASFFYDQSNRTTDVQYDYAIIQVAYDPMMEPAPGQYQVAHVLMQCVRDGTRIRVPITINSLSLLPSPQQRELEAQAAKDAKSIKMLETVNGVQKHLVDQKAREISDLYESLETKTKEIKSLKSQLAMARFEVDRGLAIANQNSKEVKRLETVCGQHWEAKCDTERKWAAEASEHDNTKNQLREAQTGNSQLLNANSCQASKIQALESQLNLLKHQYEGKCRAVRELQATGSAKERDEYSKALDQLQDKLRRCEEQNDRFRSKLKQMDSVDAMAYAYQMVSMPVVTDMSLPTRIKTLETRVTKLEEAEGLPMESYKEHNRDHGRTMLYMGGHWVQGYCYQGAYYSDRKPEFNKDREWDKANQPTRWKPMPK